MAETKVPGVQYTFRLLGRYFIEHGELDGSKRRLSGCSPQVMAEEEEFVSVRVGLGDVKVGAEQWYEDGVKDIIDKLV